MKSIFIDAVVQFTDDSRNIAHQTTTENLLVKIIKNFEKELKEVRGVDFVYMHANVKQTVHTTPESSGIAALGGDGPTGPKSIMPHIDPTVVEHGVCGCCGCFFTTFGCKETVCNYQGKNK